jgi:hypothetical protein
MSGLSVTIGTALSRTVGHISNVLEQLGVSFNTSLSVERLVGSVRSISSGIASTASFVVNFFINGINGVIYSCPPICPITIVNNGGGTNIAMIFVISMLFFVLAIAVGYALFQRRRTD